MPLNNGGHADESPLVHYLDEDSDYVQGRCRYGENMGSGTGPSGRTGMQRQSQSREVGELIPTLMMLCDITIQLLVTISYDGGAITNVSSISSISWSSHGFEAIVRGQARVSPSETVNSPL